MSRRCEITGKGPQYGHNVSHANNKTLRRFLPNLQPASFYSRGLERSISVRSTTHGIRTVEAQGGIDAFLLGTAPTKLQTPALRRARKQLIAKVGEPAKPEAKKRFPSGAKRKAKKAAAKKAA